MKLFNKYKKFTYSAIAQSVFINTSFIDVSIPVCLIFESTPAHCTNKTQSKAIKIAENLCNNRSIENIQHIQIIKLNV